MIKLYINPVFTNIYFLDPSVKQYYLKVFDNFLTFKTKTYYFTQAYQEGSWDGKVRMYWEIGKTIRIFSGDVLKAIKLFKQEGRQFELVKSYRHNIDIQDVELQGVKLRPYQDDAVNICKKRKRGMIACPTGGGKTEVLIKLVADINVPFVIIVNRTTLLNQIYDKIQVRTGLQKSEVNVISGEIKRYDPNNYITVATFQSLLDRNLKNKEYRDVLKKAKGIIIDECFTKYVPVITEDGPMAIGDLVKKKYNKRVWSYNIKKNKFELKKVVRWFKRESDNILNVKLISNKFSINCTKNHNIYIEGFKKKAAEDLKAGDKVIVKNDIHNEKEYIASSFTDIQKQIVLGTILGDANIVVSKKMARLRLVHGEKQYGYFKYKKELLRNIYKDVKGEYFVSSPYNKNKKVYYGVSKSSYDLKEFYNMFYKNGKKQIYEAMKHLIEISFAFWIMDDGTFVKNKKQDNGRYALCSHGFSKAENKYICKILKQKFDISGKLILEKRCNKYGIIFEREDTKKIAKLIYKYVPESMQYKLPLQYRKKCNFKTDILDYCLLPVESVSKTNKKENVYNIEVEGNHNYLVNGGILVKNCHHISHNKIGNIAKAAENTLYRFGFSATPYREDGYDPFLIGLMGPIIFKISISELIEQGYLAKPKIFFYKIDLDIDKRLSYDTAYESMIEHPKKNEVIANMAFKLAKKDKKVLISVKRLKHMDVIYNLIEDLNDGTLVVKKVSGSNRQTQKQEAIKKLNTGEYNIVASTLFGEGIDIPNLDVLINARSLKSSIDTLQQIGRILRMGDHNSTKIYIDFAEYSSHLSGQEGKPKEERDPEKDYMRGYAKKRIKVCKQEPAFDVSLVENIDEMLDKI